MTTTSPQPRRRVSIDFEVWQKVEALLLESPAKVSLPIIDVFRQTGGIKDIDEELADRLLQKKSNDRDASAQSSAA